MGLNKIVLIVSLSVVMLLSGILGIMYVNYNTTEVELRQQAEAQRGKVEAVYDNMWKIIHQTNEVKESYSSDFKDVVKGMMEGRYSKGDGSLMKLIVEQNPNLSPTMYTRVMDAIQIERTNFTTQQERMLDIIREHNTLLNAPISGIFIKNKKPIDYTVISSTRAKKVMESGVDDNVNL